MALTNIQKRVERSIYKVIRLKLVAEGYLPDITNITLFPKNQTGANAYKVAIKAIKDSSKKFCIELKGTSSPQAKGEIQVPRIVVITQRALPGDVGTPLTSKEVNGDHYEVTKHPFTAANMQVDVKIVWNTEDQLRICESIISATLSTRNYIDFYDTPGDSNKIYLEAMNTGYDVRDAEQGVTETTINYQIKDLYMVSDELIVTNGPLITEIKVDLNNSNLNTLETITETP